MGVNYCSFCRAYLYVAVNRVLDETPNLAGQADHDWVLGGEDAVNSYEDGE